MYWVVVNTVNMRSLYRLGDNSLDRYMREFPGWGNWVHLSTLYVGSTMYMGWELGVNQRRK